MEPTELTKPVPAFPSVPEASLPRLGLDAIVDRMRESGIPLTAENYHGMAMIPEEQWGNAEVKDNIPLPFRMTFHPEIYDPSDLEG